MMPVPKNYSDHHQQMTVCIGCGAEVPVIDGPTHRYLESAPGCWALYGEVLAREYSDVRYVKVHQLTVDAYALQHPGRPSPQTIQSAAVHLMSLYLKMDRNVPAHTAVRVRQEASRRKERYNWLHPPRSRGTITVAEVQSAVGPQQHAQVVRAWAADVWDAWEPHHRTVKRWTADLLDEIG